MLNCMPLQAPKTGLETGTSKEILSEQDKISCYKPSLNVTFSNETSSETTTQDSNSDSGDLTGWTFNNLIISCSNHIALLKLILPDGYKDISESFDSPPLYKELVIPQSWREIMEKSNQNQNNCKEVNDEEMELKNNENSLINTTCNHFESLDINGLMNKQLIKSNVPYSMNERLAKLEELKEAMRPAVQQCAPYTALKLYDMVEIKFKQPLRIPTIRPYKRVAEKATRLIQNCNIDGGVSTDRSTHKSSCTSIRSNKSSFSSQRST